MELPQLYRQMARSRAFELAVEHLWNRGLIPGEMHLGTGEEAVAAGVVTHLREGDGLALTHRCTPPLVMRGVPLAAMLREMMGREGGLANGRAGHMHLFSRDLLAASSGIVGASLPTAAGFALANRRLRPGAVAVAFTGAGALNQGMALETLNLATVWRLPLVVVCIDNGWAITSTSDLTTAGDLADRARSFGWRTETVDGVDVLEVHHRAHVLIEHGRMGNGPSFLLAACPRLDGHFLGDPLLRMSKEPLAEGKEIFANVMAAAISRGGGGLIARAGGMTRMMAVIARARRGAERDRRGDPMRIVRRAMKQHASELASIDAEVAAEIEAAVADAMAGDEGAADA